MKIRFEVDRRHSFAWRPLGPVGRGIALAVGALTISVTALAAWLIFTNVAFSATTLTLGPVWALSATGTPVNQGAAGLACSASVVDNDNVNLGMTGADPGDRCNYTINVRNQHATIGLFVQPLTGDPTVGGKFDVLQPACGVAVPAGGITQAVLNFSTTLNGTSDPAQTYAAAIQIPYGLAAVACP